MDEKLKGFKGYEKGLVCRDKQYAENTVFEESDARICHSGIHFCVNPLDVLDHYPLLDDDCQLNDFTTVEALDECKTDDNKKFCTTKLKVGAKLSLPGFVKACIDFLFKKTKVDITGSDINTEDESVVATSGYSSKVATSGDYSKVATSGDSSQVATSGDFSKVVCTGEDSVICCAGINSTAKAKEGCWITLAEWKLNEKKGRYIPICVKSKKVDGKNIKADTFYKLENKKFIEV